MESKVDYEDAFMEQEIDITPELADKLDGRCFMDLDMSERVEGFCFEKAPNGLKCKTIGADAHYVAYIHTYAQIYGKYKIKDTWFGTEIINVKTDQYLIKEIDSKTWDDMVSLVRSQKERIDKQTAEWEAKQKQIFKQAGIYKEVNNEKNY